MPLRKTVLMFYFFVFLLKESVRQKQIGKLEEELKMREHELDNVLSRQREVRVSKSSIKS